MEHAVAIPTNSVHAIGAVTVLVVLTFVVGLVMLGTRVREMRAKRIHPQAVATSNKAAARYENVQAADNFRNLFETPVLFYALVAVALGVGHVPTWLAMGAWLYVGLRVVHTLIHCTYNNVMHRLAAFMLGFGLLVGMWLALLIGVVAKSAN